MGCLFLRLKSVCHLRRSWVAAGPRAARFCTSIESSSLPSRISPWLMLPPSCDGGGVMLNNFYSLAQNKVVSVSGEEVAGGYTEVVGSSHGWLALFKKGSRQFFLWNPLSGGRINLPPIQESKGIGAPVKMILSCSPDRDGCRAVMSYSPEQRLAVCCPGLSTEWTTFGAWYHDDENDEKRKTARVHEDFAFSGIHNRLFIITKWGIFERFYLGKDITQELSHDFSHMDSDSDSDPESDLQIRLQIQTLDLDIRITRDQSYYEHDGFIVYKYVVVSEESGDVFLVMRKIMEQMGPDGSNMVSMSIHEHYPYKTVSFDVYKVDGDDLSFKEGTLDGLAMFVGINHSFAINAANFPELKPDSIYFTDAKEFYGGLDCEYGGHDIGIFCYKSSTFSPCYYPTSHVCRKIAPPPCWFTPTSQF